MNDRKQFPRDKFLQEWGPEISSGGYLQVPHDLFRNAGELGLTSNDVAVICIILGYGRGNKVAAATIASHLGICIGTVRTSLRKLDKLKYVHRHLQQGEATLFTWGGLQSALIPYAKNRQTRKRNFAKGIYDFPLDPSDDLDTNKEKLNNEDKKEGSGYQNFLASRDELIKKKSV